MGIVSFPQEFAVRAATILGHGLEVSVTMRQAGVSVRAGSSTEAAARCDQAEVLDDAGPCVDAMNDGGHRLVASVAEAPGWERWSRQCVEEGYASALAVPAIVTEDVAVALNLYSRTPDPWTPELLTAADSYAQLAASAVRLRLELADLEDSTAGFYRDMSDTVATERAVGAIMQTNRCTAEEARRIIDSASRHRNVSPREIAEALLRALVVSEPTDDDLGT
jgi:hypothetical protein